MVNITFLEVHLDDASFAADQPFSNLAGGETEPDDEADEDLEHDWEGDATDEASSVPAKPLAVLGVLLVLVGVAAAVRHLKGGDEPDVDIETPEDDENRPVGVTVDE